jgi:hypothetical protein
MVLQLLGPTHGIIHHLAAIVFQCLDSCDSATFAAAAGSKGASGADGISQKETQPKQQKSNCVQNSLDESVEAT